MPDEPSTNEQDQQPDPPWKARIDSLTKKHSEVTSQLSDSQEANKKLEQQLTALSDRINQLSAQRPQPDAGNNSLFDQKPSGRDRAATPVGPNEDLQNIVKRAVNEAFEPMRQAEERRAKDGALRAQQQETFNEAARSAPNFADPNTEEGKAFAALWDGHKGLQQLPDGPAIAIAAVQGMMTDARRATKEVSQRKHVATVTPPGRARPIEVSDSAKANELVEKLSESGSSRGWSRQESSDYLALKMREARSRGE